MKKIVSLLTALAIATAPGLTAQAYEDEDPAQGSKILTGDTNCDGNVNVIDLQIIMELTAQQEYEITDYSEMCINNSDVNIDGVVNADDVTALQDFLLKK